MEKLIVRGYHVTSPENAEAIREKGFKESCNAYDWLGAGRYFFQESPNLAINWGLEDRKAGKFEQLVVFAANIDISNFIDLLDYRWERELRETYAYLDDAGDPAFRKVQDRQKEFLFGIDERQGHWLDQYVIEMAVAFLSDNKEEVKGVRSAFFEGKLLYPKSHLVDRQHIQIAVRDATSIVAHWEHAVIDRKVS